MRFALFCAFGLIAIICLALAGWAAFAGIYYSAWCCLLAETVILLSMTLQIPGLGKRAVLPLPIEAIEHLPVEIAGHARAIAEWRSRSTELRPAVLFRHRFRNLADPTGPCLHCGAPDLHVIHLSESPHVEG